MNLSKLVCMIRNHDWFSQFIPLGYDRVVVTSVCLRCTEQRPHILVSRHWNTAGFYTYDVRRGVQLPPGEDPLKPKVEPTLEPKKE